MAWLVLLVGLLEIAWATALKYTEGLTWLWPSLLAVATAAPSFVLRAAAMRHLPGRHGQTT